MGERPQPELLVLRKVNANLGGGAGAGGCFGQSLLYAINPETHSERETCSSESLCPLMHHFT